MIKGIDISAYQANVNFAQVVSSGIEAVYIKATEGIDYINPALQAQYQGAKAAGLKVSFYHFFHPSTLLNAQQQAEYFVSAISGMGYDGPLVLDLELNGGLDSSALSNIALAFLVKVSNLTGVWIPSVYTYQEFITQSLTKVLCSYPLWLADYAATPGTNSIWANWSGWQYSQAGSIPGINEPVDLDQFTDQMAYPSIPLIAGTASLRGKLVGGQTWGPMGDICKALNIPYTWNAPDKAMCIAGATPKGVSSPAVSIIAGNLSIAGQLVAGSAWGPISAVWNALGRKYVWNAAAQSVTLY